MDMAAGDRDVSYRLSESSRRIKGPILPPTARIHMSHRPSGEQCPGKVLIGVLLQRIRYPSQIILPRTYPNGINANSFREPSSIGDYYRFSENNPERYIRLSASHLSP
ncbi:hypothetical protein TNCT_224991 [Trichonephila clavata]|uniref:Uncharacterized protein n=1 Tax=Trichonephila clavata TaxID=2740835 RepID=A0A8X6HB07_TRICU|nr:hypothetical protein TNCT_224991 [Trichonephila clavata]